MGEGMNMTPLALNENNLYRTTDLALTAALSLSYPLQLIDKQNPRKAQFTFVCEHGLDEMVRGYWHGDLKVEPQAYFNALRAIKARLYGGD